MLSKKELKILNPESPVAEFVMCLLLLLLYG